MTRVLIVDDSPTARMALRRALEQDGIVKVVGEAPDGKTALRAIPRLQPDLVTMDVYLSHENGIDVTASIMASYALPILIVTGVNPEDPQLLFRAMQAGALEVRGKLPSAGSAGYEADRKRLVRLVTTLATVPVVTRRSKRRRPSPSTRKGPVPPAETVGCRGIVVGASTGGPPVIQALLKALPAPFSCPLAVVQHIYSGFSRALATWLQDSTGHHVVVCDTDQSLTPGAVYLAPDTEHLAFKQPTIIGPRGGPPRGQQKPSIDELFLSAAEHLGPGALAVLLTGMGRDGADGMASLNAVGALTIAQKPETCAVDSMPRTAIEEGSAKLILAPDDIPGALLRRHRHSRT